MTTNELIATARIASRNEGNIATAMLLEYLAERLASQQEIIEGRVGEV